MNNGTYLHIEYYNIIAVINKENLCLIYDHHYVKL
jgi:hypothetical protein